MQMSYTLILIIVTVVVSLAALYGNQKILDTGMLKPYRTVRSHTWYEIVTSGFLHAGIGHLFVNMFVLFFFGAVAEQMLGEKHFLLLYFSGLIFSALPSLLRHKDNPSYATLGASGAVEAVLFGFIFLNPTEPLIIILFPIPMPAWLFGLGFLAYSIYESKRGGGNVNHEAHIAGAAWGVLYMILFVPGSIGRFLSFF